MSPTRLVAEVVPIGVQPQERPAADIARVVSSGASVGVFRGK